MEIPNETFFKKIPKQSGFDISTIENNTDIDLSHGLYEIFDEDDMFDLPYYPDKIKDKKKFDEIEEDIYKNASKRDDNDFDLSENKLQNLNTHDLKILKKRLLIFGPITFFSGSGLIALLAIIVTIIKSRKDK